mmetsp:Transcript_21559/g.46404  ORF Transcript_21559/g.46404 Transcript_21559/m.46404 type:complete len:118 (-) Transcript_21559:288-641(-)
MAEEEAARKPFHAAFMLRAAYLPLPMKNYGIPLLLPAQPLFAAAIVVELADSYPLVAIGGTAKSLQEALAGGGSTEQAWWQLGFTLLEVALLVPIVCYIGIIVKRALIRGRAVKELI